MVVLYVFLIFYYDFLFFVLFVFNSVLILS